MAELDSLLGQMVTQNASDLYLGEGRPPAFRVDGSVLVAPYKAAGKAELETFIQRILRPRQLEIFERDGDLDAGISHSEFGRFRINLHRQRGLLGAVIRRVPKGNLGFEQLGLPSSIKSLAENSRGLVLITGNTGSGKSTTLAAMIHHINSTVNKHIVTIEDPIEFVHDDIKSVLTQREIGQDTRDFASALRHVVRESPDVILIGELRDMETVEVAVSASLTGHLVLASFHAIDTLQTIHRLITFFPEHLRAQVSTDLSMSLLGIMGQRLVPRADGRGRVVASEVLVATPAVRKLIREQRIEEIADQLSGGEGLTSFNRSLVSLYEKRMISFEAGAAYANTAEEFRLNAQGMDRSSASFVAEHDKLPSVANIDMRTLLNVAIKHGASDIHLTAGSPPIFRINGQLGPLGTDKLTPADVRRLLFSLLGHSQKEQFELDRELDFAVTVTGRYRFRVNAHYQRATPAVAMRLIPNTIPEYGTLGLPPVVRDLANRAQGLVLVTGPTGSGKSTTLATMIDIINHNRNCHIITIEDPIEFIHYNRMSTIEQREVGADTKSFAAALKYILRQDPDVILVGEMRDAETIAAALTAAETGHLVLATLHTNDAPQTVDRIVDVFPAHQHSQIRTQLSAALVAIIAQRLLMRTDGTGRVAAFEILYANSAVRALIREGKTHQLMSSMETGAKDGMVTLDRYVSDMYRAGLINLEEATRYVRNPMILSKQETGLRSK